MQRLEVSGAVRPIYVCSSSVYVTQVKGIALRTLYAHACREIRVASGTWLSTWRQAIAGHVS